MLLHLGGETQDNQEINRETVAKACGLVGYYFTNHHQQLMVYLKHGDSQARKMNISERILKHLKKNGGRLTVREIYRPLNLKKGITHEVLKTLESKKMVSFEDKKTVVCI